MILKLMPAGRIPVEGRKLRRQRQYLPFFLLFQEIHETAVQDGARNHRGEQECQHRTCAQCQQNLCEQRIHGRAHPASAAARQSSDFSQAGANFIISPQLI
jgi:hypothetical protein